MKRKNLFLFLAIMFLGLNLPKNMNAQVVKKKINVDGSVDDWKSIQADTVGTLNGTDLSVMYKMAWDDAHFYLMFEIEDDTAAVLGRGDYASEAAWAVDNIEVFFDLDNSDSVWVSGGANYDGVNDMQLRIHRDTLVEVGTDGWPNHYGTIPGLPNEPGVDSEIWGTSYQTGFSGMGITIKQIETETGYVEEIGIPFTFFTAADDNLEPSDFVAGHEIGFRVQVRDMDAVGEHMAIDFPEGTSWKDPSGWATITLEEATEPVMLRAVQKDITIDGDASDWSDVNAYTIGEDNAPDLAISYKLARDDKNLYMLFDIEDDTAAVLGRGDYDGQGTWAVDNVEIFLDMDNSKNVWISGGHVYDNNDYQIRVHRDTLVEVGAEGWPNNYGTIPGLPNEPGVNSDVWGTDYQTGFAGMGVTIELVETDNGYMEEMAIPFEFLTAADENLEPSDFMEEKEIGIRIQVRDMDAVGEHMAVDYPAASHWKKPNTWSTLILDEFKGPWSDVSVFELTKDIDEMEFDETDFSGHFKIKYDESAVTIMVDVKDDVYTPVPEDGTIWKYDGMEIYFDLGNEKSGPYSGWPDNKYDNNDYQLQISWNGTMKMNHRTDGEPDASYDTSAIEFNAEINEGTGYTAEIYIPYSVFTVTDGLTPFNEAQKIGFDINITDNDDSDNRDGRLGWSHNGGDAYADPSVFGTLEANADGTFDALPGWDDVPMMELLKDIDDQSFEATDLSGYFKIKYDETALSILVDVEDDVYTPVPEEGTIWKYDGMEIYFDLGNEKNGPYEGWPDNKYDNNDYQLQISWNGTMKMNHRTDGEADASYDTSAIDFSTVIKEGTGYRGIITIPYSAFVTTDGFTPITPGQKIGFELNINDNDDTDNREGRLGWYHNGGDAYADPSVFGTLEALENGLFQNASGPVSITVDGTIDAIWDETERVDILTIVNPEAHAPHSVDNEADFSGYYKVRWDEEYLYVLTVVKDDTIVGTDNGNNSDNIGVYLDPENNKDVTDPGHMICGINFDPDHNIRKAGRTAPGWNNPPYFEYAVIKTDDGFIVEQGIPADSIRLSSLEAGMMIGFDNKLNDVDDAVNVDRDQLAWNDPHDLIWRDAYRMGTIKLLQDGTVEGYTGPEAPANVSYSMSGSDVEVTWDAVDGVLGYYVIEEFSGDGIVYEATIEDQATTAHTIEAPEAGLHTYTVLAYGTGGVLSRSATNDYADETIMFEILSGDNSIHDFDFEDVEEMSVEIGDGTVNIEVPNGTDISALVPAITIDKGAAIDPADGTATDFSETVTYTITAANGDEMTWTVDVEINTGVYKGTISHLSIYPNPVRDILNIKGTALLSVEITDLSGRVLINQEFDAPVSTGILNVSKLKDSMYLLRVTTNEGVLVKQIIKE